jgi:hypothetical protein
MLIDFTTPCSIRYRRSLGNDHSFIPISCLGGDNTISTIRSTRSAKNLRGWPV